MPDLNLNVGPCSSSQQIAQIMLRLEPVLSQNNPDLMIVVGDVNSTLAGALTASKMGIPVSHVEAGLRSFDQSMPEETNRIITDAVSDYHFITSPEARDNLIQERIPKKNIHYVGNVMVDTLYKFHNLCRKSRILTRLNLMNKDIPSSYLVMTLHRPSNVDNKKNLITTPPLSYLDFLKLYSHSIGVLTDSGGIQEETTALRIPCLTLRENTERPITVQIGTNKVIGIQTERIIKETDKIIRGYGKKGRAPKFWDDKASQRIVKVIKSEFS